MYLETEDLAPFAKIDEGKAMAMIADAESTAASVAPCLTDPAVQLSDTHKAAIKAVLRRAVLRWHEVGTGAVSQQTAGPFGQSVDTTKSAPRGLFWPSEISALQEICKAASNSGSRTVVFTVNTSGRDKVGVHAPWCSVAWGDYCSCGSYLNRYEGPIPEYGETVDP